LSHIFENYISLIVSAFLGFGVGILTSIFGAGGGFIITPALNIFMRLPMQIAVGTSSLQIAGASFFALCRQMDREFIGMRVGLLMAAGIFPGTFLGTYCVRLTKKMGMIAVFSRSIPASEIILLSIFAVFITFVSAWLIIDNFFLKKVSRREDEEDHTGFLSFLQIPPVMKFRSIPSGAFSITVLVILGVFTGFISGLLGIGGGVIMMPILYYLVGQKTKYAVRTSLITVFAAGGFSSLGHGIDKNIDYGIALPLIFGSFFGTSVGTNIARKLSGRSVRKYFSFILLTVLIMVLVKLYFIVFG